MRFLSFSPAWHTEQKVTWNLHQRTVVSNKPTTPPRPLNIGHFFSGGYLCVLAVALSNKLTLLRVELWTSWLTFHSATPHIICADGLTSSHPSHLPFLNFKAKSCKKKKRRLEPPTSHTTVRILSPWAITPDGLELLRNWHACNWLRWMCTKPLCPSGINRINNH